MLSSVVENHTDTLQVYDNGLFIMLHDSPREEVRNEFVQCSHSVGQTYWATKKHIATSTGVEPMSYRP